VVVDGGLMGNVVAATQLVMPFLLDLGHVNCVGVVWACINVGQCWCLQI